MIRPRALAQSLLAVALVYSLLGTGAVRAAAPIEYTRFDVALDLRADGSLHVTETLVLAFYTGPHEWWQRAIPTARMDGLRNVAIREQTFGDRPYAYQEATRDSLAPGTYTWQVSDGEVLIQWRFEPVTSAQRIFVVEYDVIGALRVYPDGAPPTQRIWWTAVDEALSAETPVKTATVTLRLPRAVDLASTRIGPKEQDTAGEFSGDGQRYLWERDRVPAGDVFEIRITFPPLIAGAAPPGWQAADDAADARSLARQAEQDSRRALFNLLFLGAGLLLVSGGGVGLYGLWYARGRDPHAGLVADFLPQPPDDLPPGAAGTLLDERADHCDIVATLIDLARRGVLSIAEVAASIGGSARRDFELTLIQRDPPATPFEAELLRALFGPDLAKPWQPRLSEIRLRFVRAQPRIKERLYAELIARRYFPRSPEATRRRWRNVGLAGLLASVVVGVGLGIGFGGLAWFPATVAPGLPLVVLGLSQSMPKKTGAGAEAAARWRAFRRYLASIERYERVAEAEQIFDRYLPYAVAFGLNRTWVTAFAAASPVPSWYLGRPGRPFSGDLTAAGDAGRLDLADILLAVGDRGLRGGSPPTLPDVDLQEASDLIGAAFQVSSDGLFALLDAAADAFESFDLDL